MSQESIESFPISPENYLSVDEDVSEVLCIDDVKITPGYVLFENAYEGKQFTQKMAIQNCGKYLAFVRLCKASTQSLEVKSFPKGIYLSAGMKVTRTLTYTYKKALGVQKGFITIWVNGAQITYKFFVTLTQTILSLQPQEINFGTIDAVNRASSRTFYLKNSGYKGSMFAIDLGRNSLGLVVQPMKGLIPAMSSVPITIEILGSRPGEFIEEIWMKTEPPLRILVRGIFIEPKILVRSLISDLNFTVVNFTATYCGSAMTRPLGIKNFSSSHSMFCVMAEVKGTIMSLEEARKVEEDYCDFEVKPVEGRLAALKGAIIQISFMPKTNSNKRHNYSACFLKVIRMDCKDVDTDIYEFVEVEREHSNTGLHSTDNEIYPTQDSTNTFASFVGEDTYAAGEHGFSFEHTIGVCVHGEQETAGVILRPTFINLSELTLDKLYQREVLVTNISKMLPVKVVYRKVASVDVKPTDFVLAPAASLEVLVTIRTTKLHMVVKNLTFDLLAKDFPFEKNVVRKVGVAHLKIRFDTSDVVKKTRFDQCVLCGDPTDKLDSEFPYRLNEDELGKKMQNDNYYIDYIRSLQRHIPEEQGDCLEPKLLNCSMYKSKKAIVRRNPYAKEFIPLSPSLLYNVKITPKSITLRKVAAYTTIFDYFEIENLNTFPIEVLTKSSKSCIVFDRLKHIIKSKEKKQIVFSFSTNAVGKYNVTINVLINDSTLYEITAVAQVVPKTLKIESNTIQFSEDDGYFKIFRLINTLNAYTVFSWEVPPGCYDIQPRLGGIQAERSMLCLVTYNADPADPITSECTLNSESGQQSVVNIRRKKRRPLVVFDNYNIDVGMISLNKSVTKTIVLKNFTHFQSVYRIENPNPIPGVVIEPTSGALLALDSQAFTITILLKNIVEFSLSLEFHIDEIETINVNLNGRVSYPNLVFKPSVLHFRRISPYSFDTLAFRVKNSSESESFVTFPLEDLPEFSVNENEDDFRHQREITLPPASTKILFLHFFPKYVSTYSLFLPYTVNGIVGPSLANSGHTHNARYFLESQKVQYDHVPGVTILNYPTMLHNIRINCAATDESLVFSNLDFNFVFYGKGHYNNVTNSEFVISNVSSQTVTLCIRTDNLLAPFSLSPKSESDIEYYSISYKITLKPDEKIVFEAEFTPTEYGKYAVSLPIFLRHYFDDKTFNYLKMTGVYDLPKITPMCEHYYLEPVPLGLTNAKEMSLNLLDHFENCRVSVTSTLPGVNVILEQQPDKGDFLLNLNFNYKAMKSRCFKTELLIRCSCQARSTIQVTGAVESCILTTHACVYGLQNEDFKLKKLSDASSYCSSTRSKFVNMRTNLNTTCFPLFPEDDDHSDYAEHMRSVQRALETWLYSQGYYLKSYHRLPDGYANFCRVSKPRVELRFGGFKKPSLGELPLVTLLTNFAGADVKQELKKTEIPETDGDLPWMKFIYTCRYNVLRYLHRFNVYLPHVETKYLLNYQQYLLFQKIKHPKETPADESTFRRRSKQCYVDLILQIIKVFVFNRVIPISSENEIEDEDDSPPVTYDQLLRQALTLSMENIGENVLKTGIYGAREKVLIKWLQMCYDQEQDGLWSERPKDKEIIFFDEDLRDGLVLGAVIAHYIPYVREEIKDMYSNPRTYEEMQHNACTLVKTCQLLRFSYIVSPEAIDQSNTIEMLLLVTYLYSILPNYTPKATKTIEAPLTEKCTVSLQLDNLGKDPIVYEILFFNNANDLFTVEESTITISPESTKSVKVQYHAKFVESTTTIILFSGETPGQKFGKSLAITLLGVADVAEAWLEIPIQVNMYKPCEISLVLQSPFPVQALYNLLFGMSSSTTENYHKLLCPWMEIKRLKRAKELVMGIETWQFDEEGTMTIAPVVCLQKMGPRDVLFYFVNPEVGDWGVNIRITGKVTEDCYEHIDVKIPENYSQLTCRCKKGKSVKTKCPKLIYIQLPKINTPLWNARKKMILYNVEDRELKIWSNIIYTSMGTRILKLIYNSETHPLGECIPDAKTYVVEVGKPKFFITVNKVVIDDIISEEFFEIPIHPLKKLRKVKTAEMRLVSEDGGETRFYRLHFKKGAGHRSESVVATVDN